MFPGRRAAGPQSRGWLDKCWWTLRAEAGLEDVRLHDLRHIHASIALREGVAVFAIGPLLGQSERFGGIHLIFVQNQSVIVFLRISGRFAAA